MAVAVTVTVTVTVTRRQVLFFLQRPHVPVVQRVDHRPGVPSEAMRLAGHTCDTHVWSGPVVRGRRVLLSESDRAQEHSTNLCCAQSVCASSHHSLTDIPSLCPPSLPLTPLTH